MSHSEESCSGVKPKGSRKRKKETVKKPALPHIREETIEMKKKQSQPSTSGAVVKTKDVIETLGAKDGDESKKEEEAKDGGDTKKEKAASCQCTIDQSCGCIIL